MTQPPSRGAPGNARTIALSGPRVATGLTNQARSIWAKSGARAQEWLPLSQHMIDSGAMTERLFDHWLAPAVRRQWGEAFPAGEEDARALVVFLASVHDVGKASPVFVAQVETLADRARRCGLPCPTMDELRDDRRVLPHATVSFLALEEWLLDHDVDPDLAEQMASIVGAHHGRPAGGNFVELRGGRQFALGGPSWAAMRTELIDWIDQRQDFSARLGSWEHLLLPLPVQVGMCGLVIMADWLASNQDFFALRAVDDDLTPGELDASALAQRWEWGWAAVAMPAAWNPEVPQQSIDDLYAGRFGWPVGTMPRPLQTAAAELVARDDVGLMVIESDMGSGKTEAALVGAEIMAGRCGAQGLFIALPTQATTDAMFGRMLPWLGRLPQPPDDVPAWAMTLAHGKAALNRAYAAEVEAFDDFAGATDAAGGMAGIHDGEDPPEGLVNAVAHQWFRGRKRRLLANFGIGTIDQVLMAGLQQKHLMLRHLALAGKVVVLDECHASDDFMNVYLDRVLAWLGHYGAPVIALSATLTEERRRAMIRAYAPDAAGDVARHGYPQISWVSRDRRTCGVEVAPAHAPPRTVRWEWLEADDESLLALLERELATGGCALVVRNTVKDAQRVADLIRQRLTPEITLAHSRFLAADRADRDEDLRQRFGPAGGLGSRPERAVVVATQVVEQSLDVDFDVLITDLAPMDLLFQRIGRLHRHGWRTRPAALTEARAYVIAEEGEGCRQATRGSRFVYGDHHLLRTAVVLEQHGHCLELPTDIAPLVERALGPTDLAGDERLGQALELARAEHERLVRTQRETAAQMALADLGPDAEFATLAEWVSVLLDPDENRLGAMVRDTRPSLEVVVVATSPDGSVAMVPPWMPDPQTLDTSSLPDDDTARRIASWSVKLPTSVTPGPARLEAVAAALERGLARGWAWHRHRLLKGVLFLPMRQTSEGSATLETKVVAGETEVTLRYSPDRGMEEVRDDFQPD